MEKVLIGYYEDVDLVAKIDKQADANYCGKRTDFLKDAVRSKLEGPMWPLIEQERAFTEVINNLLKSIQEKADILADQKEAKKNDE